jgi:hypothetical protein
MIRGQGTVEYAGLLATLALVALGLGAGLGLAGARLDLRALVPHPRRRALLTADERALRNPRLLALVRRAVPTLVLERDRYGADQGVPVDDGCRAPACAAFGLAEPVLYVHLVRRRAGPVVELWTYYPDSLTDHLPVPALRGYHRDDWEGLLVAFDSAGRLLGARVSAHGGWNGSTPWWNLDAENWAPYRGLAYRASGSHALGLRPGGIDLSGDAWNGTLGLVPAAAFTLRAADRAGLFARRFDPGAVPPWAKAAWRAPGSRHTGPPGTPNLTLGRAARAWALAWSAGHAAATWAPRGMVP